MAFAKSAQIGPEEVAAAILYLRGQKVMLDADLARLYGIETKLLTRAVRRNAIRFPPDFMFQLTIQELALLRRQVGTSSWGGRRHLPYVRAFVRLRALLSSHEELARKLAALERRYDSQFKAVFDAIRQLMAPPKAGSRPIGFGPWNEKP